MGYRAKNFKNPGLSTTNFVSLIGVHSQRSNNDVLFNNTVIDENSLEIPEMSFHQYHRKNCHPFC